MVVMFLRAAVINTFEALKMSKPHKIFIKAKLNEHA